MIPLVIPDGLIEATTSPGRLLSAVRRIPSVIPDGLIEAPTCPELPPRMAVPSRIPSVIPDGLIEASSRSVDVAMQT